MLYLSQGTTHGRFLPYHAQAESHYCRAAEEFESLKTLHRKLPNEPIFESQPEQNKTTCAELTRTQFHPRLTLPAKGKDVPGPRPRPGRAS